MDDTIDQILKLFSGVVKPEAILNAKLTTTISSILIKARNQLEMSQAEFAQYLKVDEEYVANWENGKYDFKISELAILFTILDYDVDISITKNEDVDLEDEDDDMNL